MGDGVGKSDSPPNKADDRNRAKTGTHSPTTEGPPQGGPGGTGDQHTHSPVGDPNQAPAADRCREEGWSAEAVSAAGKQDASLLQRLVGDYVMPLLTVAFQAPVANYGDAVYDPQKQAELLYRGVQDPAKQTELIDNQKIADNAIMHHTDYLPSLPNTQARRDLMAYALGNNTDCAHCGELRNLVGNDYWNDVLLAGSAGNVAAGGKLVKDGRLLDPRSADRIDPANPANLLTEGQLWAIQAEILAKVASQLVKDDNSLLHPEQIDRYNPNPKFRPLDEPLPPPADFNHHLPEQFSSPVFVDAQGNPRVFNVRDLCRRDTLSNIRGELKSDLDTEERAVLALHTEVLNQTRPWWLLADGDIVKDANMRAQRDLCRDNILASYAGDFEKFDLQIAVVTDKNQAIKNQAIWQQKWNQYKTEAVGQIPSTAQAMHFVTRAEGAAFTPEQKKARGWDTRNQTDAELIRETIRLAQWRHLVAVRSFVNDGVLFPQAAGTKHDAYLPSAMQIQERALISGTNVNDFRNPSVAEDPARRFATRQLIWDFSRGLAQNVVPTSYPSMFGDSITAANGQVVRIAPDNEINKWVSDNLTRWKDHGYPWPLAYVYNHDNDNGRIRNTNAGGIRSQRNALDVYRQWKCFNSNEARKNDKRVADNPPSRDGTNVFEVRKEGRAAQIERDRQRRAAQQRPVDRGPTMFAQPGQPPVPVPARIGPICECIRELEPNREPFKAYRGDPLLPIYQAIVP